MTGFFDRLFRRNKTTPRRSSAEDIRTAPLSEEQLKAVTRLDAPIQPAQYIVGCAQSVGMQRDHNEDTIFVLNSLLSGGDQAIPAGLFIIADGMGGHEHGEVASAVAARVMADTLLTQLHGLFTGGGMDGQETSLQEILASGVAAAQRAVTSKAPGGGTTLTVALALGSQIIIAHVGDSRAYLFSVAGSIHAITQDHSLVQRLIELGELSEEEARVYPHRNVLYRAIGQVDPLHPDIHSHEFPHPGYLMLCSDGLWGVVPESEIFQIVQKSASVDEACRRLVEAANNEGGPDNISVILVKYPR
ncbi:MAG TPA: protein phosphatase 2C domain-containing protein [Anaerolineaceae bacterium]